MSADIDAHVTSQYEINKRIGKGVSECYISPQGIVSTWL